MTPAALALLAGCYAPQVDFGRLKPGDLRPARSLIDRHFDTLCSLGPYQERLDKNLAVSERVNAHLSQIRYQGGEGDWALVLVRASDVEVLHFRRSATLDWLTIGPDDRLPELPGQFAPASRVDAAAAVFGKIQRDDRTFIILGKMSE